MAPFGKVHSALHHAGMRVKSGLLRANHQYRHSMHLASRANDLFETGEKVAGLFMPAMDPDRMLPGAQQAMMGGIGRMDRMRDNVVSGHQEVMDRIRQNSDLVAAARAAKPMLQPCLS